MKKSIRAWMILTIVFASISFVFLLGFGSYLWLEFENSNEASEVIAIIPILTLAFACFIGAGVAIIPFVVNCVALKVYARATRKRHVTPIAIILLFAGNPVSGIMLLCLKDEDFHK